jgi:orotate phosphoribosyltransferase
VFVVFYYDIFPESKGILKDIGVRLHHLATWWDVLRVAKQGGHFEPRVIDQVERFLNAPAAWSAEHGGVAKFPQG